MMLFRMLNKGLLIVFEGIDGSGKTTQAKTLLRRLRARGIRRRLLPRADGREVGP